MGPVRGRARPRHLGLNLPSLRSGDSRGRLSPHSRSYIHSLVLGYWGFGFGLREQIFGGQLRVEDQVEEADHHLV